MSNDVKAILEREAVRYERDSIAYMNAIHHKGEKSLIDDGMRIIKLEGKAAKYFLKAANSAVWQVLQKRSKNAGALRKLVFPDIAS